MKSIVLIASSLWFVGQNLPALDIPELDRLRDSHKAALDRATKPLTQTYVKELEKLRDAYTRSANLDAAKAAQAEINAATQNAEVNVTTAKANILGGHVDIPASSMDGYVIGPLKKGASITVSYVDGKWKNDGVVASEIPDAETTARGDLVRLAISTASVNGTPGKVLAVVPAGTQKKPFTYRLDSDQENVVLRINESGTDFSSNPGQVSYKLKITR